MAVNLSLIGGAGWQFFDDNGTPLSGGFLHTYAAGTTTPQDTYTTSAGNVAHANPVTLDSAGRVPSGGEIWLTDGDLYKFVLKTSTGALLATWDNVSGSGDAAFSDYTPAAGSLLAPGPVSVKSALDSLSDSATGATNVGFLNNGAGSVDRTVAAKLSEVCSVLDFGADSTGVSNSTDAFLAAVAACDSIHVPSGTYKISSTVVIPANCAVYGDGPGNTIIDVVADAVAFQLSSYSQLRQLSISPSASHTKNLVDIGAASTNNAGRSVLSDLLIDGAGANGIELKYGNLGLMQSIKVLNCGNDGIHLSSSTVDNNAWTLTGFIDLINNSRDGLHIAGGSSVSDPTASRTHQISGVTSQQNGRYGVYIGGRSNLVSAYTEVNTTSDAYLDTYAYGNEVKTTEGYIVNNCADSTANILYNYNAGANYWRIFQARTRFSGVSTAGWMLSNDDSTAGQLTCSKLAAYTYGFTADAATNETFRFTNSNASGYLSVSYKGNIYGEVDSTFSCGTSSYRWSVVYAATGAINTSDANQKQDIAELDVAEKRVALKLKQLIKKFRFRDAVAVKGANARIHVGVIAQDVKAVFESENLNADEYGVFCSDTMEDGTTRLGIRYDELFAFVVASI